MPPARSAFVTGAQAQTRVPTLPCAPPAVPRGRRSRTRNCEGPRSLSRFASSCPERSPSHKVGVMEPRWPLRLSTAGSGGGTEWPSTAVCRRGDGRGVPWSPAPSSCGHGGLVSGVSHASPSPGTGLVEPGSGPKQTVDCPLVCTCGWQGALGGGTEGGVYPTGPPLLTLRNTIVGQI